MRFLIFVLFLNIASRTVLCFPLSLPLAMASEGQPPPYVPSSKSWADVAASSQRKATVSPLADGPVLNKLKANSADFIRLDQETISRAHSRFQTTLYGKFFGKPPLFDQVKEILSAK